MFKDLFKWDSPITRPTDKVFYFDFAAGNNANDGLTAATAFKDTGAVPKIITLYSVDTAQFVFTSVQTNSILELYNIPFTVAIVGNVSVNLVQIRNCTRVYFSGTVTTVGGIQIYQSNATIDTVIVPSVSISTFSIIDSNAALFHVTCRGGDPSASRLFQVQNSQVHIQDLTLDKTKMRDIGSLYYGSNVDISIYDEITPTFNGKGTINSGSFLKYQSASAAIRNRFNIDNTNLLGNLSLHGESHTTTDPVPNATTTTPGLMSPADKAAFDNRVVSVNGRTGDVTLAKADVGLGNVDNTSDLNKPISTATQDSLDLKADLVGGKVPVSQLPVEAIAQTFFVATPADLVTLTTALPGDFGNVTTPPSAYILSKLPPTTAGNWIDVTNEGGVIAVNGKTGVVTLNMADIPDSAAAFDAIKGSANPLMDGTVAVGSASKYAREDHRHPTDTSRASTAAATTSAAGLLSAADKTKLDGITAGAAVTSVAGKTGAVTLAKADVGLGNVDNTADANKTVASAAKLTTARTIAASGDVTATATAFDGSANITLPTTAAAYMGKTYTTLAQLGLNDADLSDTDCNANMLAIVNKLVDGNSAAIYSSGGNLAKSIAAFLGQTSTIWNMEITRIRNIDSPAPVYFHMNAVGTTKPKTFFCHYDNVLSPAIEIGVDPFQKVTFNIPAVAGWYRIAETSGTLVNALGQFAIGTTGTYGTMLDINAFVGDNRIAYCILNVDGIGQNNGAAFNAVRLVMPEVYNSGPSYLEIYNIRASAQNTSITLTGQYNWNLYKTPTAGSLPAGYVAKTKTINVAARYNPNVMTLRRDIYIDTVAGNDNNDGYDSNSPVKTFARALALAPECNHTIFRVTSTQAAPFTENITIQDLDAVQIVGNVYVTGSFNVIRVHRFYMGNLYQDTTFASGYQIYFNLVNQFVVGSITQTTTGVGSLWYVHLASGVVTATSTFASTNTTATAVTGINLVDNASVRFNSNLTISGVSTGIYIGGGDNLVTRGSVTINCAPNTMATRLGVNMASGSTWSLGNTAAMTITGNTSNTIYGQVFGGTAATSSLTTTAGQIFQGAGKLDFSTLSVHDGQENITRYANTIQQSGLVTGGAVYFTGPQSYAFRTGMFVPGDEGVQSQNRLFFTHRIMALGLPKTMSTSKYIELKLPADGTVIKFLSGYVPADSARYAYSSSFGFYLPELVTLIYVPTLGASAGVGTFYYLGYTPDSIEVAGDLPPNAVFVATYEPTGSGAVKIGTGEVIYPHKALTLAAGVVNVGTWQASTKKTSCDKVQLSLYVKTTSALSAGVAIATIPSDADRLYYGIKGVVGSIDDTLSTFGVNSMGGITFKSAIAAGAFITIDTEYFL